MKKGTIRIITSKGSEVWNGIGENIEVRLTQNGWCICKFKVPHTDDFEHVYIHDGIIWISEWIDAVISKK